MVDELREQEDHGRPALSVLARAVLMRPRRRLLMLIRVQTALYDAGHPQLARAVSNRIYARYNCLIPPTARVGKGVLFAHPVGVVIGEGAIIGDQCIIFQNVTLGKKDLGDGGYPTLGSGVVLFSGAQVFGSVRLADNVQVGALSMVTESCDLVGARLVGCPARVLGAGDRT